MKESTLEPSTVRAIFQLLEDPELSKKEFAQACKANRFYYETFGAPASNHRERCRNFHKRRREERKVKPHLYVRKCIAQGIQVNYLDREVYNIYCETLKAMPTAPTFSSPNQPSQNVQFSTPKPMKPPSNITVNAWTQDNNLGDKWVMYLRDGHIFLVLWTDAKLDAGSYEIKLADDGFSLVERKRKPAPTNAEEMLGGLFPEWASDDTNFVVKAVNNEIRAQPPQQDEWEEKVIVEFPEEMMRTFYDVKGKEEGSGRYYQGRDGRQTVAFFLRTVASQKKKPNALQFKSAADAINAAAADDMDEEVTVTNAELLDEVEARIQNNSNTLLYETQQSEARIQKQVEDQLGNFSQQMMMQMTKQFADMMNQMQQQGQQQHTPPPQRSSEFEEAQREAHAAAAALQGLYAQGPPVPDGVGS